MFHKGSAVPSSQCERFGQHNGKSKQINTNIVKTFIWIHLIHETRFLLNEAQQLQNAGDIITDDLASGLVHTFRLLRHIQSSINGFASQAWMENGNMITHM